MLSESAGEPESAGVRKEARAVLRYERSV